MPRGFAAALLIVIALLTGPPAHAQDASLELRLQLSLPTITPDSTFDVWIDGVAVGPLGHDDIVTVPTTGESTISIQGRRGWYLPQLECMQASTTFFTPDPANAGADVSTVTSDPGADVTCVLLVSPGPPQVSLVVDNAFAEPGTIFSVTARGVSATLTDAIDSVATDIEFEVASGVDGPVTFLVPFRPDRPVQFEVTTPDWQFWGVTCRRGIDAPAIGGEAWPVTGGSPGAVFEPDLGMISIIDCFTRFAPVFEPATLTVTAELDTLAPGGPETFDVTVSDISFGPDPAPITTLTIAAGATSSLEVGGNTSVAIESDAPAEWARWLKCPPDTRDIVAITAAFGTNVDAGATTNCVLAHGRLGDVDCDGTINLLDARAAALYSIDARVGVLDCDGVATGGAHLLAADVDATFDVNLLDARAIALCAISDGSACFVGG